MQGLWPCISVILTTVCQPVKGAAAITASGDSISMRGRIVPLKKAANGMQKHCYTQACCAMNVTDADWMSKVR